MRAYILVLPVCVLMLALSCTSRVPDAVHVQVNELNERAYFWRYRNIDTLRNCALRARELAQREGYAVGEVEAMSALMLERFQQTDFAASLALADTLCAMTNDDVELAIADVMRMKIAQRTSDNHSFFTHRTHAQQCLQKAEANARRLSDHERLRLDFARSEFHIVSSTYFYYIDQLPRASDEILAAERYCHLENDTAQWLNFNYMLGSGGLIFGADADEVSRREFDYLFRCFTFSKLCGFEYFLANSLQSLSLLFADSVRLEMISHDAPEAIAYLKGIYGADSTDLTMARAALDHFQRYGDRFQEACALRTLGELHFEHDRPSQALACYDRALTIVGDRALHEWKAAIYEQMSVAYSALGMKYQSDQCRNAYLDLRELTREDAEQENRLETLQSESRRLQGEIAVLLVMAILLMVLFVLMRRHWRRRVARQTRQLCQMYRKLLAEANDREQQLTDVYEELQEQRHAAEQRISRNKRQNLEKRAKLQLVYGIVPFLDRISHEVSSMKRKGETNPQSLQYIGELVDRINEYNDLLTQWIEMQRGQLSLQITSFPLDELFTMMRGNRVAFEQKGVALQIDNTDLVVKADRALTLFMLNTLADNARKFTPRGGRVTVSAHAGGEDVPWVELSVTDTGVGMSQAEAEQLLTSHHTLQPDGNTTISPTAQKSVAQTSAIHDDAQGKGYGFGLMNCRGIIEKYRKTNSLFRICTFGVESRVGQGSRFYFRLPRVLTVMAIVLVMATHAKANTFEAPSYASSATEPTLSALKASAYRWADSVYYANVDGRHDDALHHAALAIDAVNRLHRQLCPTDGTRLSLRPTINQPAEYEWFERDDSTDFTLILGLRNEIAVAALAEADWALYRYNNRIYAHLYKLLNQDTTLEEVCLEIEQSQTYQRVALILIVLLTMVAAVTLWFLYVRPRIAFNRAATEMRRRHYRQLMKEREQAEAYRQKDVELATDEHRRRLYEESQLHVQNQIIDNCLSTIKHETMYYPSRIQQLIGTATKRPEAQLEALAETVTFYRQLYMTLTAQAEEQSAALSFRRMTLQADEVTAQAVRLWSSRVQRMDVEVAKLIADVRLKESFRGDSDLLDVLFDSLAEAELQSLSAIKQSAISCTLTVEADGRFARFTFTNPYVSLSEHELETLFTPHEGAIPWLLMKQVMREHDTFLGHPGCRINVEACEGGGHRVWFTLPLTQNSHKQTKQQI